jgi:UDP-2-acetamido-3-amino-2,3-dideoxy-glucuronate N-acetyltransferase
MSIGEQVPKIRVGVVGCGGWGKNLVRNFAELGALVAVVDPDQNVAGALAKLHGVAARSYDHILADETVDAVVIAAPAVQHFELARQALMAGKHVYVEKPLALDLMDAQTLCELAEQRQLTLMVGHLLQYHPVFLTLKRMVAEGDLGKLNYIYSNRLNIGKLRREEDVMWSFAPHDISMILAIMGAEPSRVSAVGSYHLQTSVADVTTMHLEFPNGANAHVFVSWLHPFKEQKLVLIGSKAMAVFDDTESWDKKLMVYAHDVAWQGQMPVAQKAEGRAVAVQEMEPLREECRHFLESVANRTQPRTDGREGLRVLKVLSAAADALLRGRQKPVGEARVFGRHAGVFIHETAYVDDKVAIGENSKIWHFSHLLSEVRLGENCNVGQNVVIGPRVQIGNNVKIQNNVSVYEGVTLDDDVFCGPSCVFTNVNNPRSAVQRKAEYKPTQVKRGASIGANATIVCGHTLGQYCFIAAGAVVADDVPDYAIMAGVPARRIGWMSKAGVKLGPDLVCPQDGSRYRETASDRLALIEG